jgi:hypothetical protein
LYNLARLAHRLHMNLVYPVLICVYLFLFIFSIRGNDHGLFFGANTACPRKYVGAKRRKKNRLIFSSMYPSLFLIMCAQRGKAGGRSIEAKRSIF